MCCIIYSSHRHHHTFICSVVFIYMYISFFRLVYKWFNFIYKMTYVLGIIGYVIMMLAFFGLNMVFGHQPQIWMDPALLFIYYGLYYGVLGRDLSEICTEKLAANIGVKL